MNMYQNHLYLVFNTISFDDDIVVKSFQRSLCIAGEDLNLLNWPRITFSVEKKLELVDAAQEKCTQLERLYFEFFSFYAIKEFRRLERLLMSWNQLRSITILNCRVFHSDLSDLSLLETITLRRWDIRQYLTLSA